MDFIIKRRVKQLLLNEHFLPVIKSLRQPVLSSQEAFDILCKCVPWGRVWGAATPMRIVKKKGSQNYYWLLEFRDLTFAVKIGCESEVRIGNNFAAFSAWFEEIPMSMSIEIPLKDCSAQTKENTSLYVSVFYNAVEGKISLQTLNLRGIDIRDFPHGYWNVGTVDDRENIGCCGSIRFVKKSDLPEMNLGGLEIYDTVALWTGSKTLKIFKRDEEHTAAQMLEYWEKFFKAGSSY